MILTPAPSRSLVRRLRHPLHQIRTATARSMRSAVRGDDRFCRPAPAEPTIELATSGSRRLRRPATGRVIAFGRRSDTPPSPLAQCHEWDRRRPTGPYLRVGDDEGLVRRAGPARVPATDANASRTCFGHARSISRNAHLDLLSAELVHGAARMPTATGDPTAELRIRATRVARRMAATRASRVNSECGPMRAHAAARMPRSGGVEARGGQLEVDRPHPDSGPQPHIQAPAQTVVPIER